jgi:hypothetical protein
VAAQEIPLGCEAKPLSRFEVAEAILAFQFGKPSGFDFSPGQSSNLTLVNPGNGLERKCSNVFDCQCALKDQLMFATRIRDTAFKRSLKTVPLGTSVKMEQAIGSFTLHKNSAKPAVLLAGTRDHAFLQYGCSANTQIDLLVSELILLKRVSELKETDRRIAEIKSATRILLTLRGGSGRSAIRPVEIRKIRPVFEAA